MQPEGLQSNATHKQSGANQSHNRRRHSGMGTIGLAPIPDISGPAPSLKRNSSWADGELISMASMNHLDEANESGTFLDVLQQAELSLDPKAEDRNSGVFWSSGTFTPGTLLGVTSNASSRDRWGEQRGKSATPDKLSKSKVRRSSVQSEGARFVPGKQGTVGQTNGIQAFDQDSPAGRLLKPRTQFRQLQFEEEHGDTSENASNTGYSNTQDQDIVVDELRRAMSDDRRRMELLSNEGDQQSTRSSAKMQSGEDSIFPMDSDMVHTDSQAERAESRAFRSSKQALILLLLTAFNFLRNTFWQPKFVAKFQFSERWIDIAITRVLFTMWSPDFLVQLSDRIRSYMPQWLHDMTEPADLLSLWREQEDGNTEDTTAFGGLKACQMDKIETPVNIPISRFFLQLKEAPNMAIAFERYRYVLTLRSLPAFMLVMIVVKCLTVVWPTITLLYLSISEHQSLQVWHWPLICLRILMSLFLLIGIQKLIKAAPKLESDSRLCTAESSDFKKFPKFVAGLILMELLDSVVLALLFGRRRNVYIWAILYVTLLLQWLLAPMPIFYASQAAFFVIFGIEAALPAPEFSGVDYSPISLPTSDQSTYQIEQLSLLGTAVILQIVLGILFIWRGRTAIQDFLLLVSEKREEQRSQKTLQLSLPPRIIGQLKQGEFVIAENIPMCTILFCGIMSFGKHANLMAPDDLIALLNRVFRRFDALVDKHNVFKVETVGSIYMVASGLPEPCSDHAERIAATALDMLQSLDDLLWPDNLEPVEIKIGINSGKVVAGVIGDKLPRYRLFGDTVNTASRMWSTGSISTVHCSEIVHSLLEPTGKFTFKDRGVRQVKGKGKMKTFFIRQMKNRGRQDRLLSFGSEDGNYTDDRDMSGGFDINAEDLTDFDTYDQVSPTNASESLDGNKSNIVGTETVSKTDCRLDIGFTKHVSLGLRSQGRKAFGQGHPLFAENKHELQMFRSIAQRSNGAFSPSNRDALPFGGLLESKVVQYMTTIKLAMNLKKGMKEARDNKQRESRAQNILERPDHYILGSSISQAILPVLATGPFWDGQDDNHNSSSHRMDGQSARWMPSQARYEAFWRAAQQLGMENIPDDLIASAMMGEESGKTGSMARANRKRTNKHGGNSSWNGIGTEVVSSSSGLSAPKILTSDSKGMQSLSFIAHDTVAVSTPARFEKATLFSSVAKSADWSAHVEPTIDEEIIEEDGISRSDSNTDVSLFERVDNVQENELKEAASLAEQEQSAREGSSGVSRFVKPSQRSARLISIGDSPNSSVVSGQRRKVRRRTNILGSILSVMENAADSVVSDGRTSVVAGKDGAASIISKGSKFNPMSVKSILLSAGTAVQSRARAAAKLNSHNFPDLASPIAEQKSSFDSTNFPIASEPDLSTTPSNQSTTTSIASESRVQPIPDTGTRVGKFVRMFASKLKRSIGKDASVDGVNDFENMHVPGTLFHSADGSKESVDANDAFGHMKFKWNQKATPAQLFRSAVNKTLAIHAMARPNSEAESSPETPTIPGSTVENQSRRISVQPSALTGSAGMFGDGRAVPRWAMEDLPTNEDPKNQNLNDDQIRKDFVKRQTERSEGRESGFATLLSVLWLARNAHLDLIMMRFLDDGMESVYRNYRKINFRDWSMKSNQVLLVLLVVAACLEIWDSRTECLRDSREDKVKVYMESQIPFSGAYIAFTVLALEALIAFAIRFSNSPIGIKLQMVPTILVPLLGSAYFCSVMMFTSSGCSARWRAAGSITYACFLALLFYIAAVMRSSRRNAWALLWVAFCGIAYVYSQTSSPISEEIRVDHHDHVIISTTLVIVVLGCTLAHIADKRARMEFLTQLTVRKEAQSSQQLLANMLPTTVLKMVMSAGSQPVALNYEHTSVLFADIVGFTSMSAMMETQDLVLLLNDIFGEFDRLCDIYKCYKVETIGDCYFCCSGCPNVKENHAEDLVEMALDMQEAIRRTGLKRPDGEELQFRIGIHSGPVIAGVVGAKCPRMHLFGVNVQIAEEMEQGGVPDCVNVSNVTRSLLLERKAPFKLITRFDEADDPRTDMYLIERQEGFESRVFKPEEVQVAEAKF